MNQLNNPTPVTNNPTDKANQANSNINAVTNKAKSKVASNIGSIVPLIFVFLFFSVGIVAGYFAYVEYLRIPELNLTRDEKTQELQRVEAHANYLKSLSNLKDQLESNIKISEQAITVSNEIPQLMNQIIQIASQTLSNLESLVFSGSTTQSTGTKTPGTINIQTTINGNYSQVIEFLKSLENARRVVTIKGLKYTSKTKGPETGSVALSGSKFVTNSDLNSQSYDLSLTVAGYFLGDINTENLDAEILAKPQDPTPVVNKLESMTWYDQGSLNLQVGTSDPFQIDVNNLNQGTAKTSPVILNKLTPDDGFAN